MTQSDAWKIFKCIPTLPALELGDDHDWAEGLLLSDVHVVQHVSEDGGLKEEACRVNEIKHRESPQCSEAQVSDFSCLTCSLHLFSSTDESSSLLHAALAVLHQFVQVGLVVLWAVVCGAVKWVTDLHLLNLFNLRNEPAGWMR